MGNPEAPKIPSFYRFGYEPKPQILPRFSRRIFLKGCKDTVLGGSAIIFASILDSAAQRFRVKPQDTTPFQATILTGKG